MTLDERLARIEAALSVPEVIQAVEMRHELAELREENKDLRALRALQWSHDERCAEQRGYERGLREGREAERADVVAWMRATCSGPEHVTIVAIGRGEHVATPQGDEPGALVFRQEDESNDSNKPAPKACATCWAVGGYGVIDGTPCADCNQDGVAIMARHNDPERIRYAVERAAATYSAPAEEPCAICGGYGALTVTNETGAKKRVRCPRCAGESGGSDG